MLKKMRRHWVTQVLIWVTILTTTGSQLIPADAWAGPRVKTMPINWNRGLAPGLQQALSPEVLKKVLKREASSVNGKADVRPLTASEMRSLKGRGPYRNKYLQGVLPWHRQLRDVNLCTGNLFKSFTDIQVAPARGAGLAMQRTYNSQESRIGPFGVGWTHAYDIRNQDESSAPVTDENLNLSDRADFFGGQHKYHRDADGLYTPPAYLYDELSSGYDAFLVNGPITTLEDTEIGMDGTVKHFVAGVTPESANSERVCDYIQDRYGNRTTLSYSDTGWGDGTTHKLLNTVTDPSGRSITFGWQNFGTQQQPAFRIVTAAGPIYTVNYGYNVDLNLSSVTLDPTGVDSTTTYGYTTYSDMGGTETGLLTSVTDPLGHTVSYGYAIPAQNPTGSLWVSSITEPAGVDGNGIPRTQTWTGGPYYSNSQWRSGWSNPLGTGFIVIFDNYLRFTGYEYGSAFSFITNYDSVNNVIYKQTPQTSGSHSNTIDSMRNDNFTYGPHGNQLTHTITGFTGTETTTYYDASQYFQKASVTDFLGRVTTFGVGTNTDTNVGNRGSVLYVRDAGYNVSGSPSYHKEFDYNYNSYGQKVSESNMNAVVTNYTYGDQWGNLTQVTQDPTGLNRITSMVYDSGGRVTQSTDPMGRLSQFSYNNLGQPLSAAFPVPSAETVSYSYDGNGRMHSVTDNRGTTILSYEAACDRVSSVTDPVTGAVSYTYGVNGERATMSLPGGGTWTYSNTQQVWQDDPNKIAKVPTRITDDQNRIVDYTIDTFSALRSAKWNQVYDQNGALTTYCQTDFTFDQGTGGASQTRGLLAEIKNTKWYKNGMGFWVSSVLTQNDYTYNSAAMRLTNAISDVTGLVRTETYGYDELYRLTSVNYGDSHTQSYTFDAMGNRLTKVNDGVSEGYTYNNANMLLTRGANSYTNDLNGNTLTSGGRTNTWDSQNRLVTCVNGANTSNFTYASDGIRHRSVLGANTTDFVLDTTMFVREKLNGAVSATYLVGPRGPEYRRDDVSGQIRWYVFDGLGSVLAECDPNGNLTASRSYDVYGAVRTSAGTSTSRHKFVGSLGHPSEDETGLICMQYRYMDPIAGRFVSQDPALKGSNWYLYCPHNPVNYVDRNGHDEDIISIEVGMSGAVEIEGAGYQITAFAIQTGQEMRILISMIRSTAQGLTGGVARLQALLTATREWAQTQEIIKLVIEGRTSASGARFAEKAAELIRQMGDKGQLIDDGLWSQVYWLIGE